MGNGFLPRRVVPLLIAAILMLPPATAGPAPALAQDTGGDPEAVALLETAAAAMSALESFHFRLTTQDGTTTIFEGVELESVEGAVQRPESFTATVNAVVAVVPVSLEVVGIGDTIWVQDPLSGDGSYREIGVASGLADILNPDRIFLRALRLVENPTIAGEDEVDGIATTVIEGEFVPARALELVGTPVATPDPAEMEEEAGIGLNLDDPLFTQLWIDGEGRVVQLAFQGALTTAEDPGIIRVLRLSEFDQPIEITPPASSG